MKAITLNSDGLQFQTSWTEPVCQPDESLIRVKAAGICETDLQLAQGYMGFHGIPGHEFVGVIDSGPNAGRRVVGEINCSCHTCPTCTAGRATHCPNRTVLGIDRHDGAFAEYVCVPNKSIHFLPDSISDEQAVFVEPLAAAFQITKQVEIRSEDRIAILGDGRLGYLSAMVLSSKVKSDGVVVVGKHSTKLARFRSAGIQTVQLSEDWSERVDEKSFDIVVDCTGSTSGLPTALRLVRPRGTVVMKTTVAAEHQVFMAPIVIDEVSLIGSRCGPFPDAIGAIESGEIQVHELISNRFQLEQVREAFQTAEAPEAFKVVFEIG